ncbi:MAG: amidophosphoribosyltransferase, partial [Chloroflexi bacterium]|nr:amidophosphoribosyltransferase [Chloroflexota bacterium]
MQDLHESCGIFGIYAPGVDVARVTFFALYALQHRGQESAGIATAEENKIYIHTAMGLVSHVFNEDELARLKGNIAIGHNRYSTTGSSVACNAQPVLVGTTDIKLALGHNGNITNSMTLRTELEEKGYIFNSSTDSEVIANLILSAPEKDMEARIKYAMHRLQGAYSLILLTNEKLYGVRDPMGVRPLSLGSFDNGWVLASETCAFDHIGSNFIREVEPGEIVTIDGNGVRSTRIDSTRKALCIFEYIYFARPDSLLNGKLIYSTREKMGAILSREYPMDADIVMGIPDSA